MQMLDNKGIKTIPFKTSYRNIRALQFFLFQDESDESVEDEAEKEEELGSEEGEILDSDDELAIVNIKIADPNPQREKMNSRY
jgi:hypothetical protein